MMSFGGNTTEVIQTLTMLYVNLMTQTLVFEFWSDGSGSKLRASDDKVVVPR
jgi:hypothetical protein